MVQRVWDGEPSNFQWEQEGLDHIKNCLDELPIPYYARQCFSFTAPNGAVRECDLLIAVPAGFFLVELKAHRGRAKNNGATWSFGRDSTIGNPLHLTNQKAKELKGLLQKVSTGNAKIPFLDAAVFLSALDLVCEFDEIQKTKVYGREGLSNQTGLAGIVTGLLNRAPRPDRRTPQGFFARLPQLLTKIGVAPIRTQRRIGQYTLDPKELDSGPTWQDFLASNTDFPEDPPRRVRIYLTAKGSSEEARASMTMAVEREYKSLVGINHPGIVSVDNRGVVEDLGPAVVFEHGRSWQRLNQYMATGGEWLPLETRVEMIRQLADALRHAHGQRLYHRALAANSVWVEVDGQYPRLRIADWQGAARRGRDQAGHTTSWGKVAPHIGAAAGTYIAPEAPNVQADPIQLDIFGLGALAYLILTGQEPAETRESMAELLKASESLVPSAISDDMTPAMDQMVQGATCHHSRRFADVAAFMAELDTVEEEISALYDEPDPDPLTAGPGDTVGQYRIKRVLGSGGTGRALLAEDTEKAKGEEHFEVVLKVALDEERATQALAYEAEVLRSVRATHVVELLRGPIDLGGRKVLVEAVAGEQSLAQYLRREGSLTGEELKGWTRDLFGALRNLEDHGVRHRDIKPDNLGVREGKNKQRRHLFLFDFSLSGVALTNLEAGTKAYLDPFLGPPRRTSYDSAAEHYALAVTLYEMVTAELPSWGDGLTEPADLPETETVPQIRSDAFDQSIAAGLKAFFLKALHRDVKKRFDDLDAMEDAFRKALSSEPDPVSIQVPRPDPQSRLAPDLPLSQTDLSEKARAAALKRLKIDTVGQLTELPGIDIQTLRGVGLLVRNELQQKAREWRGKLHLAETAPGLGEAPGEAGHATVDAIAAELVSVKGEVDYQRCIRALVGLPEGNQPAPVRVWAPADQIERATGMTSARITQYRNQVRDSRWKKLRSINALRDLVAEVLAEHGRVMEASRLAAAILVRRGSALSEHDERLANAGAAVYAAVHVEDSLEEPRYLLHRRSDGSVLVALSDGEDYTKPTERELFDYVAELALEAQRLVSGLGEADPLPPSAEAIAALRSCASLDGVVLTDIDLVRLAADANKSVAVTPRLELYPTDMNPRRAVALTQLSAYLDDEDGVRWQDLIKRVKARFGDLEGFPRDLSGLLDLLDECDLDVEEHPSARGRLRLGEGSRTSSIKGPRTTGVGSGADEAARFTYRIDKAVESGGFRAIKTGVAETCAAAKWLAARPGVVALDVQAVFLRLLRQYVAERGNKPSWERVLAADTVPPPAPLTNLLVEVWNRFETALLEATAEGRVLFLYNATPLGRYSGGQKVLHELLSAARRPELRPHGVWLLCPTDALRHVAHLDGYNVGAIDSAGEQIRFPAGVLKPRLDEDLPAPALSEESSGQ
ncbi:BREX system serine/threonine kinase PglW [Natronoglycomyces albus]|uniref:BREX system serine/threonine kinase PglW n=1 Tax=Natronoglycomyces albus TaxID=2811108 RepID=A0A895XN00_9ACTN|nr:BREX system serine/threonine kinase PglW [Natronoglycomyces albus]QSB05152.1 BREX system serine/threonine kinase PglW [Natronoglycomyces albus]